jgi:glycosyltransferase involved in cell wall biosynthesis
VKSALVIAYYFPPIGGAGAQRPAKLVRYLPEHGYEPIVITGPGSSIGRWTPADETLSNEIGGAEVLRVPGPEPAGSDGWPARAERWLGRRSDWAKWWVSGVFDVGRSVSSPDVIYSWMSPYESAAAAALLAAELGRPWIADLGDPWALDEMMVFPTAVHRLRELGRMRRLLGSAAAVIMSTPEAVRRVKTAFPELRAKPIVAIPNGFDSADFAGIDVKPRADDAFRIVHTGYLHTELGRQQRRTASIHRMLGGEARGVDILTRSHVYLLRALDRLVARRPELAEHIELHLAGVLSGTDRSVAATSDMVRMHGYLPHAQSIELLLSADLLFLPMQNLEHGRRSSTVPGKTYEYVASGRPILAAIPDGDARTILETAGNAFICRPDDVDGMAAVVEEQVDRKAASKDGAHAIRRDAVDRFEYRNLAVRTAGLFDSVAELYADPHTLAPTVKVPSRQAPAPRRRRTVLHLAYHFPPIGGAGAQRSLKFVRYLSSFDFDSIVITGSGESGGRWTPADETLTREVERANVIVRVPGPEPSVAEGWTARGERWLSLQSAWSRWWTDGVVRAGTELEGVDAIMASMSPYETAEAAMALSARLGKPWIAGLRDPWALDEMTLFPTGLHRRNELRRMRRALASSSAIVVTTAEAVTRIRETFPELRTKPIVSIPNGFDATDFVVEVPERRDGVFRIVHTGYLHTELGEQQRRTARLRRLLGGDPLAADIFTRSHVYLLEALQQLVERRPELESRVELHLAGVLSPADVELATQSPVVRLHGYVSHAEAVALIRSADLLFLPMQDLPEGHRSSTVPGKTYEYLASGRPVLGAIPAGDAHDILKAAGNAHLCRPADTAAILDGLEAEVDRWLAGTPPPAPPAELLARFERRHLTAQLAALMERVVALEHLDGVGVEPVEPVRPELADALRHVS